MINSKCFNITGAGFDLRKFNQEILNLGVLPIFLLQEQMHEWIDQQQGNITSGAEITRHPFPIHVMVSLLFAFRNVIYM